MVSGGFSTVGSDLGAGLSSVLGYSFVVVVLLLGAASVVAAAGYAPLRWAVERAPFRRPPAAETDRRPTPVTDGSDLPTIDLLIPANHAADGLEAVIRSVRAADYPADRLHLSVITQSTDPETWATLRRLSDTYAFGLYEVPADYPGEPNKPRALNYAYAHTDAGFVGVIDAGDLVAPDLFRTVAAAFRDRGGDFALAPLDVADEDHRRRIRLRRTESSFWYELVASVFARANVPVPLGSTACFVRRPVLDQIAEARFERDGSPWSLADRLWLLEHGLHRPVPWDPNNDTGDFELEQYLREAGYAVTFLDPATSAEPTTGRARWLDQRVRGQQGKL